MQAHQQIAAEMAGLRVPDSPELLDSQAHLPPFSPQLASLGTIFSLNPGIFGARSRGPAYFQEGVSSMNNCRTRIA